MGNLVGRNIEIKNNLHVDKPKSSLFSAVMTLRQNTLIITLLFATAAVGTGSAVAQDPEYTQFFNNPIHVSPAYAGAYGIQGNVVPAPRVVSSHRNQWPAMSGAYVTSGITFDRYVRALHGGLAFRIFQDDAGRGTLSTLQVASAYNYRTKIAEGWYLNLALEAAYFQRHLDWTKLSFRDMIDPSQGFIFTTQDIYREGFVRGSDFRAGGMIHSKRWTFGIVGSHLNEPNESVAGGTSASIIPIKFTAHIAGTILITDKPSVESNLRPQAIFHSQGDQKHFNAGANFDMEPRSSNGDSRKIFSLGMWYRGLVKEDYRDACMLYAGVETAGWKFGYSYDLTFSQLTPATGGAHEINLTFYFMTNIRKRFFCPDCDWHILNTADWMGGGEQRLGRYGNRSNWWNGQRIKRSKRIGFN